MANEKFQNEVLDFIVDCNYQASAVQQSLKAHASGFFGQQGTSAWIIYPEADEIENGPDEDRLQSVTQP